MLFCYSLNAQLEFSFNTLYMHYNCSKQICLTSSVDKDTFVSSLPSCQLFKEINSFKDAIKLLGLELTPVVVKTTVFIALQNIFWPLFHHFKMQFLKLNALSYVFSFPVLYQDGNRLHPYDPELKQDTKLTSSHSVQSLSVIDGTSPVDYRKLLLQKRNGFKKSW